MSTFQDRSIESAAHGLCLICLLFACQLDVRKERASQEKEKDGPASASGSSGKEGETWAYGHSGPLGVPDNGTVIMKEEMSGIRALVKET